MKSDDELMVYPKASKEPKEEGFYLNRTLFAGLIALCVTVMAASANALIDVAELKVELRNANTNHENFKNDIKEDIGEIKQDVKLLLQRSN